MRGTVIAFPKYDQFSTARLLEAYACGPARVRAALAGLDADDLRRHPRPGKWSIQEIAVHLSDAEVMGAGRIRLATAQPGVAFVRYDQQLWASALGYQSY